MKRSIAHLSAVAALAIGAATLTAPASAAKCAMFGGEATMVTEGLAKFMANAALENSIKSKSAKAAGPVKMDCKSQGVGTYCIAKQKACN